MKQKVVPTFQIVIGQDTDVPVGLDISPKVEFVPFQTSKGNLKFSNLLSLYIKFPDYTLLFNAKKLMKCLKEMYAFV